MHIYHITWTLHTHYIYYIYINAVQYTNALHIYITYALIHYSYTLHIHYIYITYIYIFITFMYRAVVMLFYFGMALCYCGYGLGMIFYVTRFPERIWPGKFDYFFGSHSLWHCGVILGASVLLVNFVMVVTMLGDNSCAQLQTTWYVPYHN